MPNEYDDAWWAQCISLWPAVIVVGSVFSFTFFDDDEATLIEKEEENPTTNPIESNTCDLQLSTYIWHWTRVELYVNGEKWRRKATATTTRHTRAALCMQMVKPWYSQSNTSTHGTTNEMSNKIHLPLHARIATSSSLLLFCCRWRSLLSPISWRGPTFAVLCSAYKAPCISQKRYIQSQIFRVETTQKSQTKWTHLQR